MKHLTLCFVIVSFAQQSFAQMPSLPPRQSAVVTDISFSGSGCPAGSAVSDLSDDGQALTVLFDSFVISKDGASAHSKLSKACELKIVVDAPRGWTLAPIRVDFRGYSSLERSLNGFQVADVAVGNVFTVDSMPLTRVGRSDMVGPIDKDYLYSKVLQPAHYPWSDQCGGRQVVKVRASAGISWEGRNNMANGLMTVDTIDGAVISEYRLAWKRCQPPHIDPPEPPPPLPFQMNSITRSIYRHKMGWNMWDIPADYYYSKDHKPFWLAGVMAYELEGAHYKLMKRRPTQRELPGCQPVMINRCQTTDWKRGTMNFLSTDCSGYILSERLGFACSRQVPGTKPVNQYAQAYSFTTAQGAKSYRTAYLISPMPLPGYSFNQALGFFPK